MAKKNYLKKLTVSDGKGGTEDIVVLTPEALTDVVRVTKSRIESIDDAVAALNDKVVEAVSGDVVTIDREMKALDVDDTTCFYMDCADFDGVLISEATGKVVMRERVGKELTATIFPEAYADKRGINGIKGMWNIDNPNGSYSSTYLEPSSPSFTVYFGAKLSEAPNDYFIDFILGPTSITFGAEVKDGVCWLSPYVPICKGKGSYDGVELFNNNGITKCPLKLILDGKYHHYAVSFLMINGILQCAYAVDGKAIDSSDMAYNTEGWSFVSEDNKFLDVCYLGFNTEGNALQYVRITTENFFTMGSYGSGVFYSDSDDECDKNHSILVWQREKMKHDGSSVSMSTKEALKKLIKSLNYDLEVGGSLDVTLGGLAWVNGETLLSQANTAGTTLSNVTLRNVTIENSDIADSTISESEITGVEMSESTLDGTNEIYHVIGSPEKVKEWLEESDLTWDDEEKTEENVSVATASTEVLSKELKRLDKTKLGGELVDNGDGSSTLIFDAGTYGSSANNNIIDGGEIQSDGSVVDAGGF